MHTLLRLRRASAVWLVGTLAALMTGATAIVIAATPPAPAGPAIVWDEAGSRDLEVAYHRLHESWNAMDTVALKSMIIGDDKLATFDNDPQTEAPIKLRTKADLDRFTDKIFDTFKTSHVKSVAEHPMIACRVSGAIGICTEECRVQLYSPDGAKQIVPLRASAVAVNDHGTWRFIQWHMSPGGPVESYDRAGNRLQAAAASGGR